MNILESIWNNTEKPKFKTLMGEAATDVLIIGGGMCGLLCAYMLDNAGVDYILVESGEICSKVTNGTTAKLTVQHGLIYDKIIKKYGIEKASLYYESQKDAFDMFKKVAEASGEKIEICNSFVYSKRNRAVIENEADALNKIGGGAVFRESTELPFKVAGAVGIENQAKIHPLKMAYAIAKKLNIYENTKVVEIKNNVARAEKGTIKAKKIIVATHFPFINKHGWYFIKMYQHRSYVLALKDARKINDMYVDEAENGLSFRSFDELLLLGGGSHRTGQKGGSYNELRRIAKEYYPRSQEVCAWATQDCMTLDSVPYIGRYSRSTPDLYVATGFNKWGMTSSMVAAMILTDMIQERKNKYEEVYSPYRGIFHPQLAVNMIESVKGLVTVKTPRCPHLGCALKYNKQEHSWDCPCHGSRFEKSGKLIDNPATDDMWK